MGDIYQNPESWYQVFVNAFHRKSPNGNNRHIVDKANELWKNNKSDESKVSEYIDSAAEKEKDEETGENRVC